MPHIGIVINTSEAKGDSLFDSSHHARPWPAQGEVPHNSDIWNPGNSSGRMTLSYAKAINYLHNITILWPLGEPYKYAECCWRQYCQVEIRLRSIASVVGFAFCTTLAGAVGLGPPVPPKSPIRIT